MIFFVNDTATTEIYTLSLHDALPISPGRQLSAGNAFLPKCAQRLAKNAFRSEEHTSELQSLTNLVCRLLLEKKKHIRDTTRLDVRAVLTPSTLLNIGTQTPHY